MRIKYWYMFIVLDLMFSVCVFSQNNRQSTKCEECGGRGFTTCEKSWICPACNGKGGTYDYYLGRKLPCGACAGAGHLPCVICNGRGTKICSSCCGTKHRKITYTDIAGTGLKICSVCDGKGHNYRSFCNACAGVGVVVNENRNINSNGSSNNRTDNINVYQRKESMHGDAECPSCHKTGKCTACAGRGWYRNKISDTVMDCSICHGTGRCQTCHGKGTIHY